MDNPRLTRAFPPTTPRNVGDTVVNQCAAGEARGFVLLHFFLPAQLAGFRHLKLLTLSRTAVTKAEIEGLRKALPNLQIAADK